MRESQQSRRVLSTSFFIRFSASVAFIFLNRRSDCVKPRDGEAANPRSLCKPMVTAISPNNKTIYTASQRGSGSFFVGPQWKKTRRRFFAPTPRPRHVEVILHQ